MLSISESHFPKWITLLKLLTAEIKMFLGTVSVLFDLTQKPQSNMVHSVCTCDFFCAIVVLRLPETRAIRYGGKQGDCGKRLLITQCLGVACSFYYILYMYIWLKAFKKVFCHSEKFTFQIG